jgi:zinc protease
MRQVNSRPGFALPLLTLLALVPAAAQTPQTSPSNLPPAREIIDRYIREIGGRDVILKQTSSHALGTVSLPAAGLAGQMEAFHAKPNKFLQRMTLPGIGIVEDGFDGTIGWSVSPLTGPSLLEGKQLEQRQFDADFFEDLKPAERYRSITTVEKTIFEERPVYKIRLVMKTGEEDLEFYETETGLKVGTITTRESPMGPMQGTTSYADYKQFGPLRQPTTMKVSLMSTQMVMSIAKLEYGTVDPSVFTLPPQIKALVK